MTAFMIYMLMSPLYLLYFVHVARKLTDVKLGEFMVMGFAATIPVIKEIFVLIVIFELYGDRIVIKKIN